MQIELELPPVWERVQDGIAWLDNEKPRWLHGIKVRKLNEGHMEWSIGGQVFGDFIVVARKLPVEERVRLGFQAEITDAMEMLANKEEYAQQNAELQKEWTRALISLIKDRFFSRVLRCTFCGTICINEQQLVNHYDNKTLRCRLLRRKERKLQEQAG